MKIKKIGILGARGYVGNEVLNLLSHHPKVHIHSIFSRSKFGQKIEINPTSSLIYKDLSIENLELESEDAFILALPNGEASKYVNAIHKHNPEAVILDLSSDYRLDDTWSYRIPELHNPISGTKISNPGCYATAMQFMVTPLKDIIIDYVNFFGISGHSGAGATPNSRNDKQLLSDNVIAYSLVDHLHEREVKKHCYEKILFTPHVAEFFRGILMTGNFFLTQSTSISKIMQLFETFYVNHKLIQIQTSAPNLQQVRDTSKVIMGGFEFDTKLNRLSFCCVIDNLLKGAATQAIQNLNSSFGFEDNLGIIKSN